MKTAWLAIFCSPLNPCYNSNFTSITRNRCNSCARTGRSSWTNGTSSFTQQRIISRTAVHRVLPDIFNIKTRKQLNKFCIIWFWNFTSPVYFVKNLQYVLLFPSLFIFRNKDPKWTYAESVHSFLLGTPHNWLEWHPLCYLLIRKNIYKMNETNWNMPYFK